MGGSGRITGDLRRIGLLLNSSIDGISSPLSLGLVAFDASEAKVPAAEALRYSDIDHQEPSCPLSKIVGIGFLKPCTGFFFLLLTKGTA